MLIVNLFALHQVNTLSKTSDDLTISLMKIINKSGPRIEPCGTPQVIELKLEALLFVATNCCLPSR